MDWKDSSRGILPAGRRLQNTIWCGGENGDGKVGNYAGKTWSVVLGRLREESRSHLGSWINECKQDRMVYKADVQSFIELAGQLEA